jgi:hypothetical protein
MSDGVRQIVASATNKVVENHDLADVSLNQLIGDMRPDQTCPARNQNAPVLHAKPLG